MNIAIDVQPLLSPFSKNRGIGNYNISQFKEIFKIDQENKYFLFNLYEEVNLKEIIDYNNNVVESEFYSGKDQFLLKENPDVIGLLIKKFIRDNNIDVFHLTSPFDSWDIFDYEWFEGVSTVVTVYDIIPYIFKKQYLGDKTTYKWYMKRVDFIKKADKILAISNSVKEDLIKHLNIEAGKIEVIYAGVDECYKKIEISKEQKEQLFNKFNIKDNFIMCTGGGDSRKNIKELIEAYSNLPKYLIEKHQLVIVCKLNQDEEKYYYGISNLSGVEHRVILTNFVSQEDLILLYNLAYILAFPSRYEGFGLPVVEAMACGTPVLTSNNSSLGEIAKDVGVLVDPFKVNSITEGLIEILTQKDLENLIKLGYERLQKFTWEKVASDTIDIYKKLEKKKNSSNVKTIKKIAFFTPLSPIKSGIADYSEDIIDELSKNMDIDVYIDNGYKTSYIHKENIKVYPHTKFEENRLDYDEIIYQMGNSEFHVYMIPYIQKYAGIVVLHDCNLHGLVYHITMNKGDFEKYKEYLKEDYKEEIDNYLEEIKLSKIGPKIYELIVNGFVCNYASKIIVHSEYAKKQLLKNNLSRNVEIINLYAKPLKNADINDLKQKHNVNKQDTIIASFGHISETKRIKQSLKAFNKVVKDIPDIHYYLVGEPDKTMKDYLNDYLIKNNLQNKVTILGYTTLDTFLDYLKMTDICINLRYPYNGETSASMMRILAAGKVSLVSDIGSFSEIPSECCVKVSVNKEEEENIEKELRKIIKYKEYREKIGLNALNFAEEHLAIDKICNKYIDVIKMNDIENVIDYECIDRICQKFQNEYSVVETSEVFNLSKTLAYIKVYK